VKREGLESEIPISEIVLRAQRREPGAWELLVSRVERVVWKAVNMITSDEQIRNDAFAATWLRLAENIGKIEHPERLPGWLATVAANEARSLGRKSNKYVLGRTADDMEARQGYGAAGTGMPAPDERLIEGELRSAMRRAFARLDTGCRELLTLLVLTEPPLSYEEVEAHFGRPHGWVGPTRGRCLDKLRRMPEIQAFSDSGATS
jgi:RNA polymerase sigma factor (sigma-70 family)